MIVAGETDKLKSGDAPPPPPLPPEKGLEMFPQPVKAPNPVKQNRQLTADTSRSFAAQNVAIRGTRCQRVECNFCNPPFYDY